jgi:hypothetical protein
MKEVEDIDSTKNSMTKFEEVKNEDEERNHYVCIARRSSEIDSKVMKSVLGYQVLGL